MLFEVTAFDAGNGFDSEMGWVTLDVYVLLMVYGAPNRMLPVPFQRPMFWENVPPPPRITVLPPPTGCHAKPNLGAKSR